MGVYAVSEANCPSKLGQIASGQLTIQTRPITYNKDSPATSMKPGASLQQRFHEAAA